MASSAATPPALIEATRNSTVAWQDDLQALFDEAKERFPDVVWELHADENNPSKGPDEVWGHKGTSCLLARFTTHANISPKSHREAGDTDHENDIPRFFSLL